MCLGIPGRVLLVEDSFAMVDVLGTSRQIRVDLLEEPVLAGDYVLSHLGFAIRRIPAEDVEEIIALHAGR